MKKQITHKRSNVHYQTTGSGCTVVLLHGYLESVEIWTGFAEMLADRFHVVAIDLPGHGKSQHQTEQTMDSMANSVSAVLREEAVTSAHIIGHSMGGYVALAFLKLHPEQTTSVTLLHSHPFADTPAAIDKRTREIALVEEGKKDLLASANIPNAFATDNLPIFAKEIEQAKSIAQATDAEGVIACLKAMRSRPDSSDLWQKTHKPALLVVGKKDNYIPEATIQRINMPEKGETVYLYGSGHQGFIEERESCAKFISDFIGKHNA